MPFNSVFFVKSTEGGSSADYSSLEVHLPIRLAALVGRWSHFPLRGDHSGVCNLHRRCGK